MQEVSRSLRTLWIIFRTEFSLYFASPLVYLVGAIWLFVSGGFFSLSLVFMNQGYAPLDLTVMLESMIFLMMFVAPALTMRLLAEEVRAGTHELLFTSPVRDWEIVMGKWLAVWAVYTVFALIMLIYPLLLLLNGDPEMGQVLTGYLGLWLLGGTMLAVGVFASALTQYQLASFMITLGILLVLWLTQAISGLFNNMTVMNILSEISIVSHYQNLVNRALIDPIDIAYFVGLTAISLFLATQVLSARRWSA